MTALTGIGRGHFGSEHTKQTNNIFIPLQSYNAIKMMCCFCIQLRIRVQYVVLCSSHNAGVFHLTVSTLLVLVCGEHVVCVMICAHIAKPAAV